MSAIELADPVEPVERAAAAARSLRALAVASVAMLLAVDVAVVVGAFLLAFDLRFVVSDAVGEAFPLSLYVQTGFLAGAFAAGLLVLQGLGDLDRPRSWPTRLRAISSAVSTGMVITVVITFDQDQRLSRAWLGMSWTGAIVALAVWRSVAPTAYLALRRRIAPRPRVVVVGANVVGQELARELEARFDVLGYVDNGTDLVEPLDRPLLAPIAELENVVRSSAVDEIVIALPFDRREQVDRVVARGFGRQVEVKVVTDMSEQLPRRLEIGRFGARPYIGFAPVARVSWVKRAVDLALSSALLAVGAPVFAAIALAIRIDSAGPVLYRQRRVGKDGIPFEMLKFRSMCLDAEGRLAMLVGHNEATGPLFKMRRDPRVTRVGRVLRRCSLDELPQLLNVVQGQMSLVGPRPPLPAEVVRYEEWQMGRLRARPGMTGLWQVSGRSEVPFNDMVRLDLHYVRNWSFGLDLEIMLRTLPAVLANRGAY
jgi:exopolysaccharide biosynthesis polyprenyl glycosylphosphotransferase